MRRPCWRSRAPSLLAPGLLALACAALAAPRPAAAAAPTTSEASGPAGSTTTTTPPAQSSCFPPTLPTTTTTTSTTTTSTTTTSTSTTSTTTTSTSTSTTSTTTPSSTTSTTTTSTTTPSSTTSTTTTTTTTPPVPPPPQLGYYLLESNGAIRAFGGAGYYGAKPGAPRRDEVVAGAATPDGGGYWVVTARGNVENFGDALFLGSPVHRRLPRPIVAMAPTPDGGGYWLATANGGVLNFGDAPFCGSAVHDHLRRPVVAIAPTPDGGGYWLATANGVVRCFGDAGCFGSLSHPRRPVVAIAPTPDGRGYWLATADGGVHNFGDAGFFGSAVHVRKPRPIVAMAATPDGGGYLLAGSSGRVYNFGDARFAGSLAHAPPRRPTHVVDLVTTLAVPAAEVVALPHHVFGYDVSNFQCARRDSHAASTSLPRTSKLTIIEVAGWLDNADNPCLAAEAAWATRAAGADGAPYELYLFVNAPDRSAEAARLGASGPHGTCANLAKARAACIAYNYGYNGARQAFVYAASQKVHSLLWWLDVEGAQLSPDAYSNFAAGQYWSASPALNDETIQGAIDGLRADGVRVGIYSTSVQYAQIAGDFVPAGARVPLWVAGVVWTRPPFTEAGLAPTSALAPWCAGTARYLGTRRSDLFAGGVPWILQETPGTLPSPYGLDPDYTC